jgi:ribosomal protein S4
MNKLKPKSKIYFQDKNNFFYIKKKKLKSRRKKKWFIIKKSKEKKIYIPENRKNFFKKRLCEKQKFRFFYGCLTEHKLKKKKNLDFLYENQLSIVLVRMQKAKSIFHSKQLISHKKVKINNKKINKANYSLKAGDIIKIIK